ncbi:MAG: hypothetical protein ACXU93_10655 [Thermodesulfobacteriota bacterium]
MSKIYDSLNKLQEKMRKGSGGKPQEREILEETEGIIKNSHHPEIPHEWLRKQRGREEKTWAYIQKRRIRWEPVSEATSYVVYVSPDRTIFDPENFRWEATHGVIFKIVVGKTELILPDEWPEFPRQRGIYYIGVTAKDEVGNESRPIMLDGLFKFIPPKPPSNGWIE